ncbi:MAG: tyrosine-type recombinase/integrase [Planctomycetaceae bacterium]|nr:tyrosine-type recombinase/integrase [Planctomycetaceae bacterium]
MPKTKQKPDKPRKDFPLSPANNGQWCKKIRGRIHYFGVWGNPSAAEVEYLRVREYLQAGRLPPTTTADGIRMNDLCNRFLNAKRAMVKSQELSIRSFHDYHAGCAEIIEHFGKERLVEDCKPEDFEEYRLKASKGRGLYAIGKMVTLTRMVFGFAYDNELIEKPIRFGQLFARPSKKSMRLHRARKQGKHGLRMFEAHEIQKLIGAASPALKAMILLAANGGLGNSDLANLPKSAIRGNWLRFPRVKTGIDRRIPLWPETKQALTEAIEQRPRAKDPDDSDLCFITKYGHRWVRLGPSGTSNIDKITDAFNKLLSALNLKRDGLGFYALRHTFETISGGCGDQVATSAIMGHTDNSMSAAYRETVEDERLLKAVNHVHAWLFPVAATAE